MTLSDHLRGLHTDRPHALLERLANMANADPQSKQQAMQLLRPLEREDAERGNNLLHTLGAYYECGARVDKTAERLFLHRNSVRYRLDRIRSLLRLDIDEPHVIAALTIALRCLRDERSNATNAGERA